MSQKSKKKNSPAPGANSPRPVASPASLTKPVPALSGIGGSIPDAEPQTLSAPVPVWLFVLLMVLVYWGMVHLDHYGGGFNDLVFGPYESYKELADLQPKSGAEVLVARGEALYGQICIACHQSSGLGSPGLAPPLKASKWVLEAPPSRLIRIPIHGLTGPVEVEGQTWNLTMPPFGVGAGALLEKDEDLAAVLTFVRQAWGNKAPPIAPQQVKAVRAEVASRVAPWTSDELLKVQ
jgi:mono/diheme cytochrome c family protein